MSRFLFNRCYRLGPNHEVVPFPIETDEDLKAWGAAVWGEPDSHRVAQTEVAPGISVSTVFLGIDHRFTGSDGAPIVFETMVFDDYESGDCYRYATWDEAVAGHKAVVKRLEKRLCGDVEQWTGANGS
jgi:hypothetical protein